MNSDSNAKKTQTDKNRNFNQSTHHALVGIITAFKEEANLRRDFVIAVVVLGAGYFARLHYLDWLFLILAIFMVLLAEFWNTVMEHFVDLLVDRQFHPLAKKIKDISAGSVLIGACLAVIIGCVVFGHALLYYF